MPSLTPTGPGLGAAVVGGTVAGVAVVTVTGAAVGGTGGWVVEAAGADGAVAAGWTVAAGAGALLLTRPLQPTRPAVPPMGWLVRCWPTFGGAAAADVAATTVDGDGVESSDVVVESTTTKANSAWASPTVSAPPPPHPTATNISAPNDPANHALLCTTGELQTYPEQHPIAGRAGWIPALPLHAVAIVRPGSVAAPSALTPLGVAQGDAKNVAGGKH